MTPALAVRPNALPAVRLIGWLGDLIPATPEQEEELERCFRIASNGTRRITDQWQRQWFERRGNKILKQSKRLRAHPGTKLEHLARDAAAREPAVNFEECALMSPNTETERPAPTADARKH